MAVKNIIFCQSNFLINTFYWIFNHNQSFFCNVKFDYFLENNYSELRLNKNSWFKINTNKLTIPLKNQRSTIHVDLREKSPTQTNNIQNIQNK